MSYNYVEEQKPKYKWYKIVDEGSIRANKPLRAQSSSAVSVPKG